MSIVSFFIFVLCIFVYKVKSLLVVGLIKSILINSITSHPKTFFNGKLIYLLWDNVASYAIPENYFIEIYQRTM